jgi:hypothetical protein
LVTIEVIEQRPAGPVWRDSSEHQADRSKDDYRNALATGVGTKVVELTAGSTVADLLHQTDVSACPSNILIGGKDLAEFVVLEEGMTVCLVPQPKNAADREPWRETIGMFKDNPAFEEMMETVWAEREARRKSGNAE